VAPPLFETPAPLIRKVIVAGPKPDAILDPYAVFAQGEDLIVRAYEIASPETALVASRAELTAHILAAVRERRRG